MIESVHGTDASVFAISSKHKNTKALGNSRALRAQTNDVFRGNSAVSSSKYSAEKPNKLSANTQQDSYNASLEDLLGQGYYNLNGNSASYIAESKLLKEIQDTIMRINISESVLIGVNKIIDKFSTSTQFDSVEIGKIEQNIKNQNMDLEIGIYSLVRVLEEGYRALRGQGDADSDATMSLLEYLQGNTAEGAAQAQANSAEETATKDRTQSFADNIAKLLSEIDEKQYADSQESSGLIAKMRAHMAETKRFYEEKITAEFKERRGEVFYPKDGLKKQDKDGDKSISVDMAEHMKRLDKAKSDNSARKMTSNFMQLQQQKIKAAAKKYEELAATHLEDAAVKGSTQLILA